MTAVLLATILAGATVAVSMLLLSIAAPRLRVWPLPDPHGNAWRARRVANRVMGAVVTALSLAALALAVLERQTLPLSSIGLSVVGAALFLFGGSLGLLGYLRLGPAASLGRQGPLVSTGPYRFSRNPQYVGAIAVLLGFSLAFASGPGLLAALGCSAWFLVAPFAEEAWLREKLGPSYSAYLETAPRYLGLPPA